jgi:hypothetical protein
MHFTQFNHFKNLHIIWLLHSITNTNLHQTFYVQFQIFFAIFEKTSNITSSNFLQQLKLLCVLESVMLHVYVMCGCYVWVLCVGCYVWVLCVGCYVWGVMRGVLCVGCYVWGVMCGVLCVGCYVWCYVCDCATISTSNTPHTTHHTPHTTHHTPHTTRVCTHTLTHSLTAPHSHIEYHTTHSHSHSLTAPHSHIEHKQHTCLWLKVCKSSANISSSPSSIVPNSAEGY